MNYKLSIIIPVYNCQKYTDKLLMCLDKQVTDEIQVIVIDDGSKEPFKTKYDWVQLTRKENGGVSSARNMGLDKVKGEYLAFIDGDDIVAPNYIETILNKIETERFDYCYLSWKTLPGGWQCEVKLKKITDKFPDFNLCTWNRIYKFDKVKDIRFNERKKIAEDAEYIKLAEKKCVKKAFISDFMYFYRSDTPDSLTKRFGDGKIDTERIVYYYPVVKKDMTFLIDEIKKANEYAEVIVMTNRNEIKELEDYAMITKPVQMKGTELRGEKCSLYIQLDVPLKTQVVIFTDRTFEIGGIETFIYNFCMNMKDLYDITVLYNFMDKKQIRRLEPYVRVMKNDTKKIIRCDTVIVNRISDNIPTNVKYNQKIQMVHCCKLKDSWKINGGSDMIVPVSNVVQKSFAKEIGEKNHTVIHNFVDNTKPKKLLRLISATRLTFEKGEERIVALAEGLKKHNIPFSWTIFSNQPMRKKIDGINVLKPTLDISSHILSSDYLVQLSDSEGFGYSIVEALSMGVPVITTPIEVLSELGVVDGENSIIVPFDMEDIDYERIYNSKFNFKYTLNNNEIIKQWRKILGNTTPLGNYVYRKPETVRVRIVKTYYDVELKRNVRRNEVIEVLKSRAANLIDAQVGRIINE